MKKQKPRRPLSRRWVKILSHANLWPIQHTAGYYLRVADHAPDFLVRTLLRLAAEKMEVAS